MRTQEQYLEKLKSMRHNIYLDGECIGRDDPRIVKASSAIRMTFSLVDNPEMHDLMTATSHITGKTINRFTHIHQCPEDLLKKQEMTRKICGMWRRLCPALHGHRYDERPVLRRQRR